jgi:hypothetical protein
VIEATRPASLRDLVALAKYLAHSLSVGCKASDALVAAALAETLSNLAGEA